MIAGVAARFAVASGGHDGFKCCWRNQGMIDLLGLVSQAAKEQSTASATGYVELKVRYADPTERYRTTVY